MFWIGVVLVVLGISVRFFSLDRFFCSDYIIRLCYGMLVLVWIMVWLVWCLRKLMLWLLNISMVLGRFLVIRMLLLLFSISSGLLVILGSVSMFGSSVVLCSFSSCFVLVCMWKVFSVCSGVLWVSV